MISHKYRGLTKKREINSRTFKALKIKIHVIFFISLKKKLRDRSEIIATSQVGFYLK